MHDVVLEKLTVDELTVVPGLQRQLSHSRARKMAAAWDPELVGVLEGAEIVGPEGERMVHVIDGQTRMEAGRIHGEQTSSRALFDVAVYKGLDEQHIAKLFLGRNQLAQRVNAFDRYTVGLVAEDPLMLLIERAMNRTKFSFARKPTPYEIAGIGTIFRFTTTTERRFGKVYAEDHIVDMLDVLDRAFLHSDRERVNADILESLNWMLNKHEQLREDGPAKDRFVEVVGTKNPRDWMFEGRSAVAEDKGSSSGARYVGVCILWTDAYNESITKAGSKLAKLEG